MSSKGAIFSIWNALRVAVMPAKDFISTSSPSQSHRCCPDRQHRCKLTLNKYIYDFLFQNVCSYTRNCACAYGELSHRDGTGLIFWLMDFHLGWCFFDVISITLHVLFYHLCGGGFQPCSSVSVSRKQFRQFGGQTGLWLGTIDLIELVTQAISAPK